MPRIVRRVAPSHLSVLDGLLCLLLFPFYPLWGYRFVPCHGVLSTHTDYEGYCFVDLTEKMPLFINHWRPKWGWNLTALQRLLSSPRQIESLPNLFGFF
jgi:hypothetical protein